MSTILGRSSKKLSPEEALLKPDIVNFTKRHLYEIKSRTQAHLAIAEAAMYVGLFKKAGVKMDLGPVADPGVIGVVPAPNGYYTFQAISPGAIVYDYRTGKYDPASAPAPVTAPVPVPKTQLRSLPIPTDNPGFMERMSKLTGLTGTALILYILISEGSRVIPVRNLVPIP